MSAVNLIAKRQVKQRIRVVLPHGWSDRSRENPEGPATFVRDRSADPGVVQVSHTEYANGAMPDPTVEDLVALATASAQQQSGAVLLEVSSGHCVFGSWGSAVFRTSECPRFQTWHLSNGRDFIVATYIACAEPDPIEVLEAHAFVLSLTLTKKSWWR